MPSMKQWLSVRSYLTKKIIKSLYLRKRSEKSMGKIDRIDKTVFKKWFQDYYAPLVNFAYSYLNNRNQAEDLVQDVFTTIWFKRDKLNIESIKSYLFTSVRNKVTESVRKRTVEQKAINDNALVTRFNLDHDINDVSERYVLLDKLNNLIRQLPPKCKEAFVKSKINGLSYAHIAEEMDISPRTVENHVAKAIKIISEKARIK